MQTRSKSLQNKSTPIVQDIQNKSTPIVQDIQTESTPIVQDIHKQNIFLVNIDFDEASEAWNANKKRVGHMYLYVCGKLLPSGKRCQRKSFNNDGFLCKLHS